MCRLVPISAIKHHASFSLLFALILKDIENNHHQQEVNKGHNNQFNVVTECVEN
jgi:hypothetical protein